MLKIIIFFFYFLFFISNSYSEEKKNFLMLKNNEVNVRYGPSFDYPIKFIYKKIKLPVQLIDEKENFRRIIDHKKNSGWIHISQLKKSKSLITTSTKILFKKPTKYSKPLARLDAGRLLLVQKCQIKWCYIKTDQFSGWIDKTNVWGEVN